MSTPSRMRIGVLLTFQAQLLDVSGIDLFGMLDKEYVVYLPGPLSKLGLDVSIYYIGKETEKSDKELTAVTGQAHLKSEYALSSPVVQPGQLDVLLIPGPPPDLKLPTPTLDFVRQHAKHGTTILTVCTGASVGAQAGIFDGRTGSAPRGLVPAFRKDYPKAKWDDQRRYVKDITKVVGKSEGELWSSGGVTNGLEMIAAFIKEKVPGPLSETVCAMADVGDKGEYYDSTVGVDDAWWLGQILRAFFFGKKPHRESRSGN